MRIPNSLKSIARHIPPIRGLVRQRDDLVARVRMLERKKEALERGSRTPWQITYTAAGPNAPEDSREASSFAILAGVLEDFEAWKDRSLFFDGEPLILDNIYGFLQGINAAEIGREATVARDTNTWHRVRVLMFALTKALRLHPVLLWNRPDHGIRGVGLSDAEVYASVLRELFDYTNTFFHQRPRLDICADDPAYSGLDFIISSDVFEHVQPPVEKAFQNCHRMLKKGGVLILTVPYGLTQRETIEHFPSLKDWHLEKRRMPGGGREQVLVNVNAKGEREVFDKLNFHGGPGQTLEMRQFGKGHLLELATQNGFDVEEILEDDVPLFGIWNQGNLNSLPMILRKR